MYSVTADSKIEFFSVDMRANCIIFNILNSILHVAFVANLICFTLDKIDSIGLRLALV